MTPFELAVLDELRAIRLALEHGSRSRSALSRNDRTLLARLLPAIGGVVGSELFAVREVFASDAPALRVVLNGLTAKKVGQLFRRGNAQAIDGYQVEHHGSELNTALWRVVRVR